MPWCEECAKYWAPSAMRPDGTCPRCGADIEAMATTAKNVSLKSLARSTDTRGTDDDKAPWHFKLMVVALIAYLGWRLAELFV